jgi:hypothetical protein
MLRAPRGPQVQKFLEKSPRDDEPEPPIRLPPHRHLSILDAGNGPGGIQRIAPNPAIECDMLHMGVTKPTAIGVYLLFPPTDGNLKARPQVPSPNNFT